MSFNVNRTYAWQINPTTTGGVVDAEGYPTAPTVPILVPNPAQDFGYFRVTILGGARRAIVLAFPPTHVKPEVKGKELFDWVPDGAWPAAFTWDPVPVAPAGKPIDPYERHAYAFQVMFPGAPALAAIEVHRCYRIETVGGAPALTVAWLIRKHDGTLVWVAPNSQVQNGRIPALSNHVCTFTDVPLPNFDPATTHSATAPLL